MVSEHGTRNFRGPTMCVFQSLRPTVMKTAVTGDWTGFLNSPMFFRPGSRIPTKRCEDER